MQPGVLEGGKKKTLGLDRGSILDCSYLSDHMPITQEPWASVTHLSNGYKFPVFVSANFVHTQPHA